MAEPGSALRENRPAAAGLETAMIPFHHGLIYLIFFQPLVARTVLYFTSD